VNVAVLLACRRDRRTLLHWVGAQALAGLVYLPWFWVVLEQIQVQQIVLQWFVYIWESKSLLAHALDSVGGFTLGGFPPYFAIASPLEPETAFRLAAVALAVWGLVRGRDSACLRFVATAFGVAMALSLGYSLVAQPVHIPGRTDHVLLPLFALLLAAGFDAVRPRAAGAALAAGWIAAAVLVLVPFYADGEKDLTRAYLSDIDARPGDVVITTGKTYAEVAYYVDHWDLPVALRSFPLEAREHPGFLNYDALMEDRPQLVADSEKLAAECRAAAQLGNRCFVILVRPREINQIVADRIAKDLGAGVEVTRAPRRQSLLRHPVHILAFGPR